ncbi:hypothetical protein OG401_14475 [Kitasatospora purpeofusca]|uniref:hypothetical protein n=1 Tax=Kitasatospora purpeofusca TaxID=67352 RepID=UPI00225B68E7|nr:hypothetical protein [Kitasatospora purpeofusca]MCX4685505.1 hypothetical protein [Kitasatospora purpeofusca]
MSTATVEITLSEAIHEYTRQNYTYAWWNFEHTAEQNGWKSIGMIVDAMGSPVSSSTSSRDYQYVTHTYALHASNAETIEKILGEDSAGLEWAHGPGDCYVYNADHVATVEAVEGIEGRLANYGILNEDRMSELEYEENHSDEFECGSEDPDCGCEANSHSCREEWWGAIDSGRDDVEAATYWCRYCRDWVTVTDVDRMDIDRRINGRREWWQFTRADFSSEAASKHADSQARYRREIRVWKEVGQLDLFSGEPAPTTDDLIKLMGL